MNSGQNARGSGARIAARFDEDEVAWVFGSPPDGPAGSVILHLAEGVSVTFDRADQRRFFLLVEPEEGGDGVRRRQLVSETIGTHALSVLDSRETAVRHVPLDPDSEVVRARIWRLALLQDLEAELSVGEGSHRWWECEHAALTSQLPLIQNGGDVDEPALDFLDDVPGAIRATLIEEDLIPENANDATGAPSSADVLARVQWALSEAALGVSASQRCRSLELLDDVAPAGPTRSQLSSRVDPVEQHPSRDGTTSAERQFLVALDPELDDAEILSDHGARVVWHEDQAELTVNVVRAVDADHSSKELWCKVFHTTGGWPNNEVPAAMAPFVSDGSSLVARLKLPTGSRLKDIAIEVTVDTTRPSRSLSATTFARTIALARKALKAERFSLPTVAAHWWEEAALEWHKRRDWGRCGLALLYSALNLAGHDPSRSLELEREATHLLGEEACEAARKRPEQGLPFLAELVPLNLLDPDHPSRRDDLWSGSGDTLDEMISTARSPRFVAGVDIGHYGVRVALADQSGNIISSLRKDAVEVDPDFEKTFDRVASLLCSVLEKHRLSALQLAALGVGIPAPIDAKTGELLGKSYLDGWEQDQGEDLRVSIRQFLAREEYLHYEVPVHVDNDANLCALGEFRRGLGQAGAYKSLLFVKASAGIGAGTIENGRVVRGTGAAGEIGHNPVPEPSPSEKGERARYNSLYCDRCQQYGCLETIASGSALMTQMRDHQHSASDSNEQLTFRTIIQDASQNAGSTACKAVERCGQHLGNVLLGVMNANAPELIVIGGAFSEAGDCFILPIQEVAYRRPPGLRETTKIVPASDWEWAGVWGAIELALDQTRKPLETEPDLVGVEDREGKVLEVDGDSFLARVLNVVGDAPEEEVEFRLSEVAATEIGRVVPGALFSWRIETTQEPGGTRVSRSTLSFLPPPVTSPDRQLAGVRDAERARAAFEDD